MIIFNSRPLNAYEQRVVKNTEVAAIKFADGVLIALWPNWNYQRRRALREAYEAYRLVRPQMLRGFSPIVHAADRLVEQIQRFMDNSGPEKSERSMATYEQHIRWKAECVRLALHRSRQKGTCKIIKFPDSRAKGGAPGST